MSRKDIREKDIRGEKAARFVLLGLVFLLPGFPILADEIILVNGEHLSGKLLSMDKETIILETYYGKVEIDREKVISGTFSSEKEIPANGLVLEILFDGSVKDTSLSLHSMEVVDAPAFTDGAADHGGSSLSSDGSGQYVCVKNSEYLNKLDEFSVSLWFCLEETEKYQYLFSKWLSTRGQKAVGKFAVSASKGSLFVYVVDTGGSYHLLQISDSYAVNMWTHLVLQYSQGTVAAYINGERAGEIMPDIDGLYTDSSDLYLMTAPSGQAGSWDMYNMIGKMDNFRLYNRALTEQERKALFENG